MRQWRWLLFGVAMMLLVPCGLLLTVILPYHAPPTIVENTPEGEFVLYTLKSRTPSPAPLYGFVGGPQSFEHEGHIEGPDLVLGARNSDRPVAERELRVVGAEELRRILGDSYEGVRDEFKGMGTWFYRIRIDENDTINTEMTYDRDKYVYTTETSYRVENGRLRFLRRRHLDRSWPDLR